MSPVDAPVLERRGQDFPKEARVATASLAFLEISSLFDKFQNIITRENMGPRVYSLSDFFADLANFSRTKELSETFKSSFFPYLNKDNMDQVKSAIHNLAEIMTKLSKQLAKARPLNPRNNPIYESLSEIEQAEELMSYDLKDKEFRLTWAKINQETSFLLFLYNQNKLYDKFGNVDREKQKAVITYLNILRAAGLSERTDDKGVPRLRQLPYAHEISNHYYGLLAQAGLMKVLEDKGYYVLLPDWLKDGGKEVEMWDLNGVDMVVITPKGKIRFIDVKGSMFDKNGQIRQDVSTESYEYIPKVHNPIQDTIRRSIAVKKDDKFADNKQNLLNRYKKLPPNASHVSVKFFKIFIPTKKQIMSPTGIIKDERIIESILNEIDSDY